MNRQRWIALGIAGLVLAFFIGFVPSWSRVQTLERELRETRHELGLARLQGQLGAALAESHRGNYERARQLMAGFFSGLQTTVATTAEPDQRRELEVVLAQRDEIITLLSRAEPESTQRLMLLYTRFFAVTDPLGREAPTTLTPPTPGG